MSAYEPLLKKPKAPPAPPRATVASKRPRPPIQTALEVSEPGDALELEADRVADHVLRSAAPAPRMSAGSAARIDREADTEDEYGPDHNSFVVQAMLQRMCAKCEAEDEKEEEPPGKLQRQALTVQRECTDCSEDGEEEQVLREAAAPGPTAAASAPGFQASLSSARASGGEALPSAVRSFMEPRFGQDFRGVRVHRDATASELTERVHAKAFTVGKDVFFRRGHFEPSSEQGKRLIAHELTHVVQQREGMRSVQREIIQRQAAEPATATARPRSADLLEPGDLTRVRFKTGIVLGKEADNKVKAGVVANNTLVQVLETAENGSKLKVGAFVDGRVGKPIGWTPRRFLGAKEAGAAPPQPTTPATRQGQIQAETERLLDALEQGGEPALQAALRALESTAPSDVFVAVAQAVEAQLGPGAISPGQRHFMEFAQPRNILGHRAPGVVLPLVAGTLQAFSDRLEAFGKGLVAGLRESGVGDSDIERFVGKLAQSQVVNLVTFNSIFMAGAVKGVADDVAGTFKLLADLFSDPHRVLSEIDQVIRAFLSDNQVAFALGKDIGQNFAKSFQALSQRNAVSFSFELGKIVGPALIGVAIAIATGGAGLAGVLASRLPTFFRTLRTLSGRGIGRLRALGKRARPGRAPDVPSPRPTVAPPEARELGPGPNSRAAPDTEPAEAGRRGPVADPANGKTATAEATALTERHLTLAGETHTLSVVRKSDGRHLLTLCSPKPCGELANEIEDLLGQLATDHPARSELGRLHDAARKAQADLDAGQLAIDAASAEANRLASALDTLSTKHPEVGKILVTDRGRAGSRQPVEAGRETQAESPESMGKTEGSRGSDRKSLTPEIASREMAPPAEATPSTSLPEQKPSAPATQPAQSRPTSPKPTAAPPAPEGGIIAGSRLTQAKIDELSFDPDVGRVTAQAVTEIETAIAAERSALASTATGRGTAGADIAAGQTQLSIKRPFPTVLSDVRSQAKVLAALRDPNVKLLLDTRSVSDAQLAEFLKLAKALGIPETRILIPPRSSFPVLPKPK